MFLKETHHVAIIVSDYEKSRKSYLFSAYVNMKSVAFNHCFYTENVTNMSNMFNK